MIEDIGIFRSFRFAGRICRRRRNFTYFHAVYFQFCRTIIVHKLDFVFLRWFRQPSCGVGLITCYCRESRTPFKNITGTGRYVFANRHLIACQQVTLDLHTTVLHKGDGIFDLLFFVGRRVGHIRCHFIQCRTPTGEIISIVHTCRTSRVGTQPFRLRTIRNGIGLQHYILRWIILPIFVLPSDGEFHLFPYFFSLIPIIIGVIIRVDTMVVVILLLYFPPLTITSILIGQQDKQTSGTGSIAEGVVIITTKTYEITFCFIPLRIHSNFHILLRLDIIRIISTIISETTALFQHRPACTITIEIRVAIGLTCFCSTGRLVLITSIRHYCAA